MAVQYAVAHAGGVMRQPVVLYHQDLKSVNSQFHFLCNLSLPVIIVII